GISSISDGSKTPSIISSVKTSSSLVWLLKFIDRDISSKGVPSPHRVILFFLFLSLTDFINQHIRSNSQNNRPADNEPRLGFDSHFRGVSGFFRWSRLGNRYRSQLFDSVFSNHLFFLRLPVNFLFLRLPVNFLFAEPLRTVFLLLVALFLRIIQILPFI